MTLIVANTCLFLGAVIKFLNVVLLEKDQEENYKEPDAQAEQCLTGVGNIERKGIHLFLNPLCRFNAVFCIKFVLVSTQ